jgi:ATP synthase protein I
VRDGNENPPGNGTQWRAVGLAAGLGCSVVAGLIVCILGGVLLDRWLETTPLFTLIGVLLGILAAGGQLYRLARAGR